MTTSKYPFEDWLDGRVWLLRYQADFTCLAMSMQSMLYGAARSAGVMVATQLVGWGGPHESAGAVLIQAYPHGSGWKPNLGTIRWQTIKKAMENKR